MLFVIISICLETISASIDAASDPLLCFTAEGLLGDCRPWRYCGSVRDEYPAKKPTICIYRPKDPIVCCPHGSFTSSHTAKPVQTSSNSIESSVQLESSDWRPNQPVSIDSSSSQWRPVTDSSTTATTTERTDDSAVVWPDHKPLVTTSTAASLVSTTEATTQRPISHQNEIGDFFMGHPDCGLNTKTLYLDFDSIEFRRRKRSTSQTKSNDSTLIHNKYPTNRLARKLRFQYFDSLRFNNSLAESAVKAYTEAPPKQELFKLNSEDAKNNSSVIATRRRPISQILNLKENSSSREDRQLFGNYQLNQVGGFGFGFGEDLGYIVGGSKANLGAWPWLALIGEKRRSTTEWFCGGSLLNEKFVITAAHCLGKFKKNRLLVRLGEFDLNYDTDGRHQDLLVDRIFLYPDYRPSRKHHDLALLRLRHRALLTSLVRPVCLPDPGQQYTGRTTKVAGWGHTQYGGETSAVLQEASFPVVDTGACERQYRNLQENFHRDFGDGFGDGKLCAHDISGGGQDACQGDSGGPLTYWDRYTGRVHLVGIVSTGVGCGNPAYPGIYTRVTTYLDWIRRKAFADGRH